MSTAPTTRRGPYAKTRARRLAILQATLDLVVERGHRALTTADVAERAGVTEAIVLYHFATKENLFIGVLQDFERRSVEEGVDAPVDTLAELEERLRGVARMNTELVLLSRMYTVLFADASDPNHPGHTFFDARVQAIVGTMREQLEHLVARGEVTLVADPGRCARILVAAWDGMQAQWLIRGDFDLGDELIATLRILVGTPGRPPGPPTADA